MHSGEFPTDFIFLLPPTDVRKEAVYKLESGRVRECPKEKTFCRNRRLLFLKWDEGDRTPDLSIANIQVFPFL